MDEWEGVQHGEKLVKILYVTCEQTCFKYKREQWEEVLELRSSQEEADTRLLHAFHASQSGYRSLIVTAEDTDEIVLCIGMFDNIPCQMYQKCVIKARTRFIGINKLSIALGRSL